MKREELEKEHEDYKAWKAEWAFYVRSYFGGKHYRDGDYLKQHPFESTLNYARRKEVAYYYNYCQPIVDIFVSHLYKSKPTREYGDLAGDTLFDNFLKDADLEGTSYHEFAKSSQRYAAIYGRVSIVVDKSAVPVTTMLEAEESDNRPYLSLVTPENILDWEFARLESGRPVLNMIKIRELKTKDKTHYRIWTRDGWELWEVPKDGPVKSLDAGLHDLGEIPVLNLYNKRGGARMIGASDLSDIADINKNIYYLCSDAKEIIENTAFPMLAMPHQSGGAEENKVVGPRNILEFDPTEPNATPYWLEPPHSSLAEIREWISQDITEIFRIANLGGMINVETSVQPWTGPGQELQNQRLSSVLSQKADFAEETELAILRLWSMWQGKKFDGKVEYLRDYSIRDITTELQNAMNAQKARIDSKVFAKEIQKKIVTNTLPKLEEKKRTDIFNEIDAAEVSTEPLPDKGGDNFNSAEQ